jgi:hypothetical protein
MPVDMEQIGNAMDAFVDDDFVAAKEIISAEIRGARDTFMRERLGLKEPEVEDAGTEEEDEA